LLIKNLAAEMIPDELIEQLAPGGRLVTLFISIFIYLFIFECIFLFA